MNHSELPQTQLVLRFIAAFFVVFFITAVILFVVDFVPERPVDAYSGALPETATVPSEDPTRVVISSIGVDTVIENPTSTAIDVLDQALLSGAVRYPESAKLGEDATVYLFGHQSYLPVVRNQAFKAFNDLQKLKAGDTIQVYSDTAVYEYTVSKVTLVDADTALVPLSSSERTLVLSTCNSFGSPGERYVIEANYTHRAALN